MRFEANHIGIVKLGAIGDVVNSLPFVNRLRDAYPRARITWVIAPLAYALVEGHRAVDEFLVVDVKRPGNWASIVRELRARRFDLAIDLQRILKSGALVRASAAPVRVGFDRERCKESSWLFTTHRIPPNSAPGVTVAQYLEFADYLGCPSAPPRWDLPLAPCEPVPASPVPVVVHVGATKSANRWPDAHWSELVRRLTELAGVHVHLTGARAESAQIERVKAGAVAAAGDARGTAEIEARITSHAGRRSLKETAALIAASRLFVGSDSGPLHVAVAVGTPVVALFGAPDPARTGPFGAPEAVVRHAVDCSPCRRRDCNVPGHPCMRDLAVEVVFERARARLEAGGVPTRA